MSVKVKIRCSSLGDIMTDPRDATAKKAGELSVTAKKHLVSIYIKEKYGREREVVTKYMTKGLEEEESGITLLSRFKKKFLKKNAEKVENKFLTGHPDIFEGESIYKATFITDTKLNWDIWTHLACVIEPLAKENWWQLQGYFDITGARAGEIAKVLVDTPMHQIEDEKYYLLKRMKVATEESPEFKEKALQLERNMMYGDIPISEKVLIFPVERDDAAIEQVHKKVEKCNEFLEWFEKRHRDFNTKDILKIIAA